MKEFVCPKCGCNVAEEVIVDAVISNEVIGIEDGQEELSYGNCGECFDGYIDRYQCRDCGYVIPGVRCVEEMIEYIEKNCLEQ